MKYALVNGILLDGTEAMQPRSGLAGSYVMPGLINLHVHLPASGKPTVKQKDNKKTVRHVDLVIARGKVYRSPKVKKIEKAQRELDKFL